MLKKDIVPEEWREKIGNRCINCGSDVKVGYRFIVPIGKVGMRTFTNATCLCQRCSDEIDREYGIPHPAKRGPSAKVDRSVAYAAFDKLANGEIGVAKCQQILGYAKETHLSKSRYYREWMQEHDIMEVANCLDHEAVYNTDKLLTDCNVGRIIYNDRTCKYIRYHYSEENDIVYSFSNKVKYPTPMTITQLREKYLLKK